MTDPFREMFRDDSASLRDPAFDPANWGSEAASLTMRDAPHVGATWQRAPEGMLQLLRCERCGGRHESLIRFPRETPETVAALKDAMAGRRPRHAAVAGMERQVEIFADRMSEFGGAHRGCAERPLAHELPPPIERRVRELWAQARKRLKRGKSVPPALELLFEDGLGVGAVMGDLPDRTPDDTRSRYVEIARRHAALRELCERAGRRPVAATFIAEGWATEFRDDGGTPVTPPAGDLRWFPKLHPERFEVLTIVAVTREFGRTAVAKIARKSGVPEDGPGSVGAPEWVPLAADAPLVDGALAEPE
jgi:hypothetical protein